MLAINEEVISNFGKLRKYAETVENWRYVSENNGIRLTSFRPPPTVGDFSAAFGWVVKDSVVMRYLSVWVEREDGRLDTTLAFTVAHLLGYSGGTVDQRTGFVTAPGPDWRLARRKSDGAFVIQQDVQKIASA